MVTTYGEWIYEPDTPEEKKCDYDRIADYIYRVGYKIKTNLEHLINMIMLQFDCVDIYDMGDYGTEFTIDGCIAYIEDSGGLQEFDY